MDIERIARKLEPLMPREVEHWLRVRDSADAELKSLVEKQIVTTAHRRLGNFRNKILLSLPPEKRALGPIHLGTVLYDRPRWPLGLRTSELLQNLAIFGRSGAGKTNVAFHILEQLAERNVPFLFLDWKRTARHLLPRLKRKVNIYTPGRSLAPLAFNPFVPPPGLESGVYLTQVIDVMADAYTLGDGARSILQRGLTACYGQGDASPVVADVLREVEKLPAKDRARGWKISAVRALESLALSNLTTTDKLSQEQLVQGLLRENTIVELDALGQSSKKFLIPLLCLWLYYVKLASPVREKLELVIFVEEAHHVLFRQQQRSTESLMNVLLRQCREVGMAMIVIDQHPQLISPAVLGNTYTSICLNLKDPTDINKAAKLSLVDDDEKRYFSQLPVGQAIVKLQDRWRRPVLVQFPLVNVAKGAVTDGVLRRFLRRQGAGSVRMGALEARNGRVSRGRLSDSVLDATALRFIDDVLNHPDDGVKIRYHRLGLSAGRGTKLKETLTEDGWLEAAVVPVGRSRKVMLRPTVEARRALGLDVESNGRGSLTHEYWKRYYARKFEDQGYRTELEAPRHGGRVDVLATKGRERVAIEVETGKSHVVTNVKNCLLSRYDRVIVVATDRFALGRVESDLGRTELLIPERVSVVQAPALTGQCVTTLTRDESQP